MLLALITIGGFDYYCSDEGVSVEYDWGYNWKHYIVSLDSPQTAADHNYGGLVRMKFGSIALSPEFFISEVGEWPPPLTFDIELYNTETGDSSYDTIFSGTGHRSTIGTSVGYDLYERAMDYDLLEEAGDYNGDTVPLPRALGAVTHVNPVRLPDVSGDPTYHKGYVTGTKGSDWHIYDDGVNIDANVTDNGDGTFKLSSSPVGEVTLSGIGTIATLEELIEWACLGDSSAQGGGLDLATDTLLWDDGVPNLSHWANRQEKLLDFLSDVMSWYAHFGYIDLSTYTFYLIDGFTDNGSQELTPYTDPVLLDAQYRDEPPVAVLRGSWEVATAVEETIGKYVKRETKDTQIPSIYPYGTDRSITCYCSNKDDIETCLTRIMTLIHYSTITVKAAFAGPPPAIGTRLYWEEDSKGADLQAYMRVIEVNMDITGDSPCYTIKGNGEASEAS